MANFNELERLDERFPNKNVGCGNPDSKILVVTQKVGNETEDFKYLRKLFVKSLALKMSLTSAITLFMMKNY